MGHQVSKSLAECARETGVDDASPAVSSWLRSPYAVEGLLEGASSSVTVNAVRDRIDSLAAGEYYIPKSTRAGIRRVIGSSEAAIGIGENVTPDGHQNTLSNFVRAHSLSVASSPAFAADLERRRALARFALLIAGLDRDSEGDGTGVSPDLQYRPNELAPGTQVVEISHG